MGLATGPVWASPAAGELVSAVGNMRLSPLDTAATRAVRDLTIRAADLHLVLDSGRIAFLAPVVIDSSRFVWSFYFEGRGQFRFEPPVSIERGQLRRFCGSDSLNRSVTSCLILGDAAIISSITAQTTPVASRFGKEQARRARERLDELIDNENYFYLFTALRSLLQPGEKPFVLVNIKPERTERLFYLYNPFSSEEVSLYREDRRPGADYMELVNSYHDGLDETYADINGLPKGQLHALHYSLDGTITARGNYRGSASVRFRAVADEVRMVRLYLHEELSVDSILDGSGNRVEFLRYTDDDHKSTPLYLFRDESIHTDDTLDLTFFYEGEIAKADLGLFDVTAGGEWYPHSAYHQQATFEMTFRTPAAYEFVAVGSEKSRDTVADTLVTTWLVDSPASNVTFSIGPFKRYEFGNERTGPVEVYYSEDVHERAMWRARGYGSRTRNIQNQVAEDVVQAMSFYSVLFGPYPRDHLVVSEIFSYHGEAFPGFLHLGLQTWFATDQWGNEQVFRAHETAHQWWGVTVGYRTYHDQWLSEAFAQYAAWRYYEHVNASEGAGRFLREWRDDIFSLRDYGFGIKGTEAGPIILGPRTSGSKTEGDYQTIIYKKGAWVLHMLRRMLDFPGLDNGDGSSEFDRIIRRFFAAYAHRQASTADFQRLVEEETGESLDWFYRQWVYRTDLPVFDLDWEKAQDSAGGWYIEGTLRVEGVDSSFRMPVPVVARFRPELPADSWQHRLLVEAPRTRFRIAVPQEPVEVGIDETAVLCRIK